LKADAYEATANVVVGCLINWLVLFGVYGQPLTATGVMVGMIGLTWLRSFAIRRVFRGLE
jgi:hypothetical protein